MWSFSCDGDGVLEVKCPMSCAGKQPTPETVDCLLYDDPNIAVLNKKHQYFFQIQTQMATTGRKWDDFIFSHADYYFEKILFDEEIWTDNHFHMVYFWKRCVAPIH